METTTLPPGVQDGIEGLRGANQHMATEIEVKDRNAVELMRLFAAYIVANGGKVTVPVSLLREDFEISFDKSDPLNLVVIAKETTR